MSDKPERRQEFAGQGKTPQCFPQRSEGCLDMSKFCLLHHESWRRLPSNKPLRPPGRHQ